MKRRIVILFVLLLSLSMLTGCGSSTPTPSDEPEVTTGDGELSPLVGTWVLSSMVDYDGTVYTAEELDNMGSNGGIILEADYTAIFVSDGDGSSGTWSSDDDNTVHLTLVSDYNPENVGEVTLFLEGDSLFYSDLLETRWYYSK